MVGFILFGIYLVLFTALCLRIWDRDAKRNYFEPIGLLLVACITRIIRLG